MARPADPNAKSALVTAARAQFREHGLQRARIEDITAACGLSKGAFYLHYPSKEALFLELVTEFERRMDEMFERRTREEDAFFARGGPFRSTEFVEGSARLPALVEMQTRQDIEALELMWERRDVIHVLINGSQGTDFDGVIWHAIDREQQRVVVAADRLKKFGVIRKDLSNDVIAMVLMGAWVLTMRQMVARTEKPDFAAITNELNVLVGEGLTPRPALPSKPRKSSPSRKAVARRSPRRVSLRNAP
ncbi:MAG: helix-turn-helix domain-containing protein [Myxococcales bacterium]|nr:helix-turn-helix domain-containing protein [Myxococcales bacterium]